MADPAHPATDYTSEAAAARDRLRKLQNADDGWGSRAHLPSTTEATSLAVLALSLAAPQDAPATAGRRWLRSRQRSDGAWPASDQIPAASWMSSIAVLTLGQFEDDRARAVHGAEWLLSVRGEGYSWVTRLILWLFPEKNIVELDPDLQGWPWIRGAFGWVEPTAHALLALKSLRAGLPVERAAERIREGELMIHDRMCLDGGWNYGNSVVLDEELWPYPDTTALALLGLQGSPPDDSTRLSLEALRGMLGENRSALSTALGILCLDSYGQDVADLRTCLAQAADLWLATGDTRSIALALLALDLESNPFRIGA